MELYRGKWKKTNKNCKILWLVLIPFIFHNECDNKSEAKYVQVIKMQLYNNCFFIIVAQLDHIIGTNACCVLLIFCLFACPLLCLFKLVSVESIVRWSSVSLGAQFEPTSPWLNESGRKSKSNKKEKKEKPCQQLI